MHNSLSRDTPYLGKTDGPFTGFFHIISTPFLGNNSQLTSYLGNIMVTPFPFFYFLFFSSGLGNMLYVFYHYPRVALPQNCNVIRALSPFLGRLLKALETCMYESYPLFLNFLGSLKNTPCLGRLV